MSDSLATRDALVAPSNGQAQQASGAAQSNAGEQTSQSGQPVQDENFRRLQSSLDRQIADSKREAAAARQEAQQAQQYSQQLAQRLQQMEDVAAPDDFSRMELRVKRAEETAQQYYAAYQQMTEQQRRTADKQAALQEVVADFNLVTTKDLEDANGTLEAVKLAIRLQREREQAKQINDNDKRDRNSPDVGGGSPITSISQWEDEWKTAKEAKNSQRQVELLRTQPQGAKR